MRVRWLLLLVCTLALAHVVSTQVWAQAAPTGWIVGVVCDDQGRPLDFANIVVLGTTMGAMTRNGGQFAINQVPVGHHRLKASFVGFEPQTREVYVTANRTCKVSFCGDQDAAPEVRVINELPEPGTGELRVVDDDGDAVSSLPLRHTRIQATVAGAAAQVMVEQTFHNPFDRPIETVYVFPLPHKAAVNQVEVRIGERVLRADIRKRQEAVQVYDTARREGRVAVLLEQERPNIFTQQVANVMPGHEIVVRMRYFEQLEYDAGYELVIPTVVGPRFIPGKPLGSMNVPASMPGAPSPDAGSPAADDDSARQERRPGTGWAPDTDQVPDASRITPHVLAPGADSGHRIDIAVDLDLGVPIGGIESINHAVDVQRDGKQRAQVRLRANDTIANKDFVLRYNAADDRLRFGVLAHHAPAADFGYFTLIVQPNAKPRDYERPPLDFVLVLDVSGSMRAAPLETEKGVVRWLLQRLRPSDRFTLIQFSDHPRLVLMDGQLAKAENVLAAQRALEGLRAGGGTRMMSAIHMALNLVADPERPRVICLLTDAYVGNEDALMRAVHDNLGQARLFTVGIGSSPNRHLIDGLAREGLGAYDFVSLDEDPRPAVERFFARIEALVLDNIHIDWGRLEVQDVQPDPLPPLYFGHPLQITARYRSSGHDDIVVRGRRGDERLERRIRLRLPGLESRNEELATLWARRRVDGLSREVRNGELAPVREIQRLGLQHALVTRYTSFVATDNQVVNESGPPTLVPQPVEMPLGVRHEGVFGAHGPGLHRGVAGMVQTITVPGEAKKVDVKASDVSHVRAAKELRALPVEEVAEAVALNSGVVGQGAKPRVRGGRSNAAPVCIDGVPAADSMASGSADSALPSVEQLGLITGGMDGDYGAPSSVIRKPIMPTISMALVSQSVKRGDSVQVRVVVENNSGRALQVPEHLTLASGAFVVSVEFDGVRLRAPMRIEVPRPTQVALQAGQQREYVIALNDVDGYVFSRAGVYEIRVEYVWGLPGAEMQRAWTLTVH
jgi:Ca-activated chloride channel family protein